MRRLSILMCCVALTACGDDDTMTVPDSSTDMGVDMEIPDEGTDMGPTIRSCDAEAIETVVGVLGETQTVMADTSAIDTRPVDLGPACGNVEADRSAPQLVIEYQVPGSGDVAVEFTAATAGTPDNFDTVIQLRTECTMVPAADVRFPGTCFDDGNEDLRSTGGVTVEGGSTLFLVVTGYAGAPVDGSVDAGMVQVDISARANTRPTLTEVSGLHFEIDSRLSATGTDPDGDVQGLFFAFLDDAGGIFDLNGNETVDDEFAIAFDEDVTGETDWAGQILLAGIDAASRGAAGARVQAYDSGFSVSEPMMLDFGTGEVAGLGGDCGADILCTAPLSCDEDVCAAPEEVVTVCDSATAIEFVDGVADLTGEIAAGPGALVAAASCGDPRGFAGAETVYTIALPEEGTYDVLATTDVDATGETDTILYARSVCEENRAELACNDDIGDMMTRSNLEVLDIEAESILLFVEAFGGVEEGTAAFGLQVRLREVLETGAECDADELLNRCGGESECTDGTCS